MDEIESKLSDQASFKIKTNVLGEKVVDRELLKSLQEVFIESNPSRKSLAKALKIAVKAFRSCVARIGGNFEETTDIAVKDEKSMSWLLIFKILHKISFKKNRFLNLNLARKSIFEL